MGLFRRKEGPDKARSVTAAAVPLAGPSAVRAGRTLAKMVAPEDWQKESWYYFDAVGEYRSALTWVANLISAAELYAAEVDPDTGEAGDATENTRVIQIAQAVLGGAEQRPQLLKTMALQWQAVGESFVIVRAQPARQGQAQPDSWMALSGARVEFKGGTWSYLDPTTLETVVLGPTDLMIRVHSPHPDDPLRADSAARPALPILREIEKTSQYIAAKLDSRLAGRGIWLVPTEMSFPVVEGLTKTESLTDYILQAMTASLRNPGTAESQAPLIVEVPGELIPAAAQGLIDFATQFDAAVVELRQDGLSRLAATLDMPNETAEGSTGGMNHWGAWQVEESTWKIFGRTILEAFGDALTEHYFRPALRAAGVADAERYALAWSTAEIVARPDRTSELKELWEDGLISNAFRLQEMGVPDDAMPDEEEANLRRLERVVEGAPTLAADPEIGRRLFGFEIAPAAAGVDPAAATVPAGEEAPTPANALPAAPDDEERPDETDAGLVAAASVVALRALERAGGKLLTREHRGQYADVPKWELHRHIRPADALSLATECVSEEFITAVNGFRLEEHADTLRFYVAGRLASGEPHDVTRLRELLR